MGATAPVPRDAFDDVVITGSPHNPIPAFLSQPHVLHDLQETNAVIISTAATDATTTPVVPTATHLDCIPDLDKVENLNTIGRVAPTFAVLDVAIAHGADINNALPGLKQSCEEGCVKAAGAFYEGYN